MAFKASPDATACELVDSLVNDRDDATISPMLSLIASAIRMDLLRSSSLMDVSLDSPVADSSSVNPAAYLSIASSTVILAAFEVGRE